MRDLDETTSLVTGATDGLGKRVARELAGMGATVLLHGRNSERLEATLEDIRRETGSERLGSYLADLSSLTKSVSTCLITTQASSCGSALIAIILVAFFFVSGADAASVVMGMLSSRAT